jgi:predicted ATPase/signal transduction histidine kinase/tRNA A-37 threonylcarbamoyl transferase component Bud32
MVTTGQVLGSYTLKKPLQEGSGASSYLGIRNRDGLPVVLKVLDPRSCRTQDLERMKNAFELGRALEGPSNLRPIALEIVDGMPVLVTEDFPGDSLALHREPMAIGRFLDLSIRITEALEHLHARGVVHCDLRPDNILVSGDGQVCIRDFGGASRMPSERVEPGAPLFERSLPYLSPEQTGRINRPIDCRSDLYALGVTFYQLLAGRLPFEAHDALGWIHAHIARAPAPPSETMPGAPEAVAGVVLKLLAKMPDERYQSAFGLRRDLERCAVEWRDHGRIAPFSLGTEDSTDHLVISGRLYGRRAELAYLRAAFDRVVGTGETVLLVVSGAAGAGKTSLIAELQGPTAERHGFFAASKFERHENEVPYFVLAQAFRTLVLEVLTGSADSVMRYGALLRQSLAPNAKVIVDLIPEVVTLIGEQPPVPVLPPAEAENRLVLAFRRFLSVFATSDHPVTLFLDDLQWVDGASVRLLEELVTQPATRYLFLAVAYRDDEPLPPPVAQMLEKARGFGALVRRLSVEPLSPKPIAELIADAVRLSPAETAELAQVVHNKTGGNPFFALQFLTELARRGLLAVDPGTRRWHWDVDKISSEGFTDNVVKLMIGRLKLLPKATQDALRTCACLGSVVEAHTLSSVLGSENVDVAELLHPALEQDLLVPFEGAFRFAHDRVREAAYCLIPEVERATAHMELGRALLSQTSPEALDERVFGIVNQFDLGVSRIESEEERHLVANLNLRAGLLAKASGGYASAARYFTAGSALLGDRDWDETHDLFFGLELGRAECAYLVGDFAGAERTLTALTRRAKDDMEAARATSVLIRLHTTDRRSDKAVEAGVAFLRRVGLELSPHPCPQAVTRERERFERALGERSVQAILDLPLMTEPASQAAMDVLQSLIVAALNTDANLVRLLPPHMALLSLREGHCDASAHGFACLAALMGNVWNDYPRGARLGHLALDLVEKRNLRRYRSDVCEVLASAVFIWSEHVRVSKELHRRAFETAVDTGRSEVACYAARGVVGDCLFGGDSLDETLRQAEKGLDFCLRAGFAEMVAVVAPQRRLILSLLGKTEAFGSFRDSEFDETAFEANFAETQTAQPFAVCWYFVRKLEARYMAGLHADALAAAIKAEEFVWASPVFLETVSLVFFSALAAAAHHDHAPEGQRAALRARVAASEKRLAVWAEHCPGNFRDRYLMVAAEMARITGDPLRAADLYEEAARSARSSGFANQEALAYELASRFHRARGVSIVADAYLREARAGYVRWGAQGKVSEIDRDHPKLLEPSAPFPPSYAPGVDRLGLLSALRASQAIARTLDEQDIARMLLQAVLEEGAARTARLVFVRGEELTLEAEATIDEAASPPIRTQLIESKPVSPELPLPLTILGAVRRTGQAVVLADACASQGPFDNDPYIVRARPRSLLCQPVLRNGQVVALLLLENDLVPGAFTAPRLVSLELLATQAAISIENAQLLTRERSARLEAGFVAEVSKTLAESLDPETTLAKVARLAVPAVADWCTVYLMEEGHMKRLGGAHFDPAKAPLIEELRTGLSTLPTTHPMMRAAITGTSIVVPRVTHEYLVEHLRDERRVALVHALGTGSFVVAPLATRGPAFGAISFGSAQPLRYGPQSLALAEEIARRAAMAIENARLYKESQDSIRARDEFLDIASHELRTPVTSMRLMVQALRSGKLADSPANILRALELFARQVDRLSNLIEGMLSAGKLLLGRLEIHPAPMDLAALVRDEVERAAPELALAKCVLTLNADAPTRGFWDRSKLAAVISSLLSNAIKFGAGKPIEVSVQEVAGLARLVVVDHGIGIDKKALPHIFEKFERAVSPRSYGGLGLGLYVARNIVNALGGTVRAESTRNVETRFVVDLPMTV